MRCLILSLALAASVPSIAAQADATSRSCQFPFVVPVLVSASRLVFFGEMHGTTETPALAAEYACELARSAHGATLGLEIPASEQSQIDRYLASAGTAADQSNLLSAPHWQAPLERQDGRSSLAMLALLDRVRQLRAAGVDIDVLAFDGRSAGAPGDEGLAAGVRAALRQRPRRSFLVLVGNVHASHAKGSPWDPAYEPMAYLLASERPLSLLVDAPAGTAWVCSDTGCGVKAVGHGARQSAGFLMGSAWLPGYDGSVMLESFSASPPATLSKSSGAKD